MSRDSDDETESSHRAPMNVFPFAVLACPLPFITPHTFPLPLHNSPTYPTQTPLPDFVAPKPDR